METINEKVIEQISKDENIKVEQIKAVLEMLADEKTVAFIARYRKEVTGGLDEEKIRIISDAYNYGVNLSKRKADVIRLIEEKGLLTEELKSDIEKAAKLIEVEDLYRPYKEKKKTKASEAIALGLEGLADIMMKNYQRGEREEFIKPYINDKVPTEEVALTLAKYIVAERISDNAIYRGRMVLLFVRRKIMIKIQKKNIKIIMIVKSQLLILSLTDY